MRRDVSKPDLDFPPVPGLEVDGFRLAAITLIEAEDPTGDAWLIAPDGTTSDLAWRAEADERRAVMPIPPRRGHFGLYHVSVPESIATEADLRYVLEAVVPIAKPAWERSR